MNTVEFEFLLGSAPRQAGRKVEAKALQASGVCTDAELRIARALKFEHTLDQAFEIELPNNFQTGLFAIADAETGHAIVAAEALFAESPAAANRVLRSRRWFAIAAGVSMFAFAAFVGYHGPDHPQNALLAQHCNEHMAHEPFALTRRTVVPKDLVERMFAMNGFATHSADGRDLTAELGDVNYLSPCTVDGKIAMHLVVQTAEGPVTVLVMPNVANDGASEMRINSSLIRLSPLSSVRNSPGAIVLVAESSVSVDAVEARFLKVLGAV